MRAPWITLGAMVVLAACAGKPEGAATSAADSTAVAPAAAVADSTTKVDTSAKPATDSAAKPTAGTKAATKETGDYDQTIKPRFKIDEKTGKIDTIKKP